MNRRIEASIQRRAMMRIASLLLVAACAGTLLPQTASAFDPNPATRPPQGLNGAPPFTILQRATSAPAPPGVVPTPRPSGSAPNPCAASDANNPVYTTSYYVIDSATSMSNAGKTLAQQFANAGWDCAVILAMGQAATIGTAPNYIQGVTFLSGAFGSDTEVAALAEAFVSGYANNIPISPPASKITLILGVNLFCSIRNRCACADVTNPQTGCIVNSYSAHAAAWAGTVQQVNTFVQSTYPNANISIHGGGDIETGFNSFANSDAWIVGYEGAGTGRLMYDYGDAGGCPGLGNPNVDENCIDDWTQSKVWMVAWGHTFSVAIPEIYFDDPAHTRIVDQWAEISQVGSAQYGGRSINFSGVLTQYVKCSANPSLAGCGKDPVTMQTTTLKPHDALLLLNAAVGQTIPWSSDIKDAS